MSTPTLPQPVRRPPAAPERPFRPAPGPLVAVVAVVAALARLPFLTTPLTPDEGGFLMVAGQWHPGRSLYGDYWVDRPPLLITLLEPVARWSHAALGLHLLGTVAVVASVLLAGRVAALLGPGRRWLPVLGAVTAAVFLLCPLFGAASEVDGEVLGVPFVLASLVAALTATRTNERRPRIGWWVVAGAAALAAVGVKQSLADGFVGAAAVLVWLVLTRRRPRAVEGLVAFGAGALGALVGLLAWAAVHGTDPGPLWDAVVGFRTQAGAVISAGAPSTYHARAVRLALAFLGSGAVVVALAALVPGRLPTPSRPPSRAPGYATAPVDSRLLLVALLCWELVAVALGGSYWLHYLVGTVPGLVVAAVVVATHRPRRLVVVGLALAWAVTTTVVHDVRTGIGGGGSATDVAVERYLTAHAGPGDTGVVAFGNPVLLQASGLASPYPELWSLPVRVRDPHLAALTAVLESPRRPTWLVVAGDSLDTWGVDSATAQQAADRHYRLRTVIGDWQVLHVRP